MSSSNRPEAAINSSSASNIKGFKGIFNPEQNSKSAFMSDRNDKTSDFEGKPAVIVKQSQVNSVKNMSVQNNAPRASQNYLNNDL